MGRKVTAALVALAVVVVAAGWQYRDRLAGAGEGPPPEAASRPVAAPDVLYTWVDGQGVTHYSQQPGRGQRVIYDGSTITPLVTPDPAQGEPAQLDKLQQAAGEAAASSGNAIMDLRRELQENARQMHSAKASQTDF